MASGTILLHQMPRGRDRDHFDVTGARPAPGPCQGGSIGPASQDRHRTVDPIIKPLDLAGETLVHLGDLAIECGPGRQDQARARNRSPAPWRQRMMRRRLQIGAQQSLMHVIGHPGKCRLVLAHMLDKGRSPAIATASKMVSDA